MAGILDEVMDGITAKEKGAPQTTPPPNTTTTDPAAPTPPPAPEGKGMHEYGDEFKKKYGERKQPA
jgi:hypothetical protein